jgi:hypothetical protein
VKDDIFGTIDLVPLEAAIASSDDEAPDVKE